MIIEVKVPSPGESITEVQLASWLVKDGDFVERDAEIAEIDSDKATLTINASDEGTISLKAAQGDTLKVGALIATIDSSAVQGKPSGDKSAAGTVQQVPAGESVSQKTAVVTAEKPLTSEDKMSAGQKTGEPKHTENSHAKAHITPLAKKMMEANNLTSEEVLQQVGNKKVGKADIESFTAGKGSKDKPAIDGQAGQPGSDTSVRAGEGNRTTERKKLSTLRLKLSQRLVSVKNETAMLTTFNEVNMSNIMEIRKKYNDKFKEKYGISLGFMSVFTKAVTIALQQFPQVNSIIDGEEIIYHDYVDVGIAVSSPKGLVVPVVRNSESLSIPEIELRIKELADKARNNKLSLDEMTGGTFTISNGGVFGSLLSTPILNPPQSAILGMHNIVERPIAQNGQVVIAPMMYLALSYDHRVIDGRESVTFLVKVKEMLENPATMFYEGKDPVKGILGL
ncbi:MAG TPA: 2-oxoglutarate dehydrogenase complex dihydrolipoyllysine-residue succinyltransferase [Lentimicrobium sp.]|nr:2-oxoglutarate dehydrogenase complex dihydrolipoyllysine-residue succinyltransferase [Lentimicrobium sp.]